jgi:hypothetical protein
MILFSKNAAARSNKNNGILRLNSDKKSPKKSDGAASRSEFPNN